VKNVLAGFVVFTCIFAISCGSEHGNEDRQQPDLKPSPQPTPDNGAGDLTATSSWYGMTTKCLIDVAEKKEGSQTFLEQKVACSDIVEGGSISEVSAKLDAWSEVNCPKILDIRFVTTDVGTIRRNWGGKHFTAFGPQNAVSNSREGVEDKRSSPQFCQGDRYFNYGHVSP
jgi:hypothetical protein